MNIDYATHSGRMYSHNAVGLNTLCNLKQVSVVEYILSWSTNVLVWKSYIICLNSISKAEVIIEIESFFFYYYKYKMYTILLQPKWNCVSSKNDLSVY